jgi:hypothetical protein
MQKNSADDNAPLQLHKFPVVVSCAIGNKPQAIPELHLFKDVNNCEFSNRHLINSPLELTNSTSSGA